MNPLVSVFDTEEDFHLSAAKRFLDQGNGAIRQRGRFMVVLPGGNTPAPFFDLLTQLPHRNDIDWSRVHIVPSDERFVPANDATSNTRMLRERLIGALNCEIGGFHVPLTEVGNPGESAAQWEAQLRSTFGGAAISSGFPLFDMAILGVGGDGHTASLFPGERALEERRSWTAPVAPRGDPAVSRVTLTLPLLNHARSVLFLVAGAGKAEVVRKILSTTPEAAGYPAGMVKGPEVEWLITGFTP